MSLTKRLHQPEYIGENRCLPCTAVNLVLTAVVSVFAAIVSPILGAGVFGLSLVIIYVRGYLVPGTPTLTKRYFPKRILRWFDKDITTPMTDEIGEIDPEWVLLATNAVTPCRNGADLCLTPAFREAWHERRRTLDTHDLNEEHLSTALDSQSDDITFDEYGDAFVAHIDDTVIGQWSSQAAVVADVAAATELTERFPDWATLAPAQIARVLMSLRIFVERCPECNGPVHVEQEVAESCCRSYDVIVSVCQDCDARLVEIEWDDADTDEVHAQPTQSAQAGA
jgi:hypothetical protein